MKIVIKIGGAAIEQKDLLEPCAKAIASLAGEHSIALVHGGGAALSRALQQMGKKSEFIGGLRVTDRETRDAALMVLSGSVNKQVVAALGTAGLPAVGMCGGDGLAFRARKKRVNGQDLGFVGEICAADPRWIQAIWDCGALPVVSSMALGIDGEYYNVNADEMASACAVACHADALIFLTDVAGVKDSTGDVVRWLAADKIEAMVRDAVISGGMLPKLQACEHALRNGVGRVRILPAAKAEVLPDFYQQKIEIGTEVLVA